MPRQYRVTRPVTTNECPWLAGEEALLSPGDILTECGQATYGCIGPSGRAMTFKEDGGYPFFELPLDALEAL